MIPLAAGLLPARQHDAGPVEEIPIGSVLHPARLHDAVIGARAEEVPVPVDLAPVGGHSAIVLAFTEIVTRSQVVPTALHSLCGLIEAIPLATPLEPAAMRIALVRGSQVVPLAFELRPTAAHETISIEDVRRAIDNRLAVHLRQAIHCVAPTAIDVFPAIRGSNGGYAFATFALRRLASLFGRSDNVFLAAVNNISGRFIRKRHTRRHQRRQNNAKPKNLNSMFHCPSLMQTSKPI